MERSELLNFKNFYKLAYILIEVFNYSSGNEQMKEKPEWSF